MFTLELLKAQRQQMVNQYQQKTNELVKLEGAISLLDSMINIAEQSTTKQTETLEPQPASNGATH